MSASNQIQYATKADIERLERGQAEIRELLRQLLQELSARPIQTIPSCDSLSCITLSRESPAPETSWRRYKQVEQMLSIEDLIKLRPLEQPKLGLPSLEDLRQEAVFECYSALKHTNLTTSKPYTSQLSECETFKMAQHMELCVVAVVYQKLVNNPAIPYPDIVLQYLNSIAKRCNKLANSDEFRRGIKSFRRLASEKVKKAACKVHKKTVAPLRKTFGSLVRYLNRPAAPVGPPPAISVPSIEIEMEDAPTDDLIAASSQAHKEEDTKPMPSASTGAHQRASQTTVDLAASLQALQLGSSSTQAHQRASHTTFDLATSLQALQLGSPANGNPVSISQSLDPTNCSKMLAKTPTSPKNCLPARSSHPSNILTSDKMLASDLAQLQQPSTPTPGVLSLSNGLRGETIADFYDTLVGANTKIQDLKQGLGVELLQKYVLDGIAPFWNDFVPLSKMQLINIAKHYEGLIVQDLEKKIGGQMLSQSKQEMEYQKLAAKLGISSCAKGIERFAMEAAKLVNSQSPM